MTAKRHKGYLLGRTKIGSGGQAEVFAATSKVSQEKVALKRVAKLENKNALARLRREIDVQSTLSHANIVPILDSNAEEGWFTMPLARGDLAHLREQGYPILPIEVLMQVGNGLRYAHGREIIHRDVKPQNVLLFEPSTWKISDWGFVKRPPGETTNRRTRVGATWGTEGFVAPEVQRDGHKADARSDVFSLGRLAYWLVAEQWPPEGDLDLSPLSSTWRDLISLACEREPSRRMQTVAEFLGELDTLSRVLSADDTASTEMNGPFSTIVFGALLRECARTNLASVAARSTVLGVRGAELRRHILSHSTALVELIQIVQKTVTPEDSFSLPVSDLFDWVDLVARAAGFEGAIVLQQEALSCLIRIEMSCPDERHRRLIGSTFQDMLRDASPLRAVANQVLDAIQGSREHLAQ